MMISMMMLTDVEELCVLSACKQLALMKMHPTSQTFTAPHTASSAE